MYKLCKTEQSANRQRFLEEGLLRAMNTKRYEEINISDLCQQMGIPRKTFYRYFSSKDGALRALLDHVLLELENATGFLSGSGFDEPSLLTFFTFWMQQRQLLDVLRKNEMSGMLVERAVILAQTEYSPPSQMGARDLPMARIQPVTFGICGLMSMVLQWHHMGFQESAAEMAAMVEQMMHRPLIHTWKEYH